ncbi:GNAT family N-acetyltransferase [Paenibacillus luteus]|uniref:GNAT family N-acetyltransferase n=1 Tax=Paenibacillus luteus TaxID=2545753 RepID=UPI001375D249|nr:GNAT family N-acetyltransferase [Paenibacillus luteus]
MSHSLTIETEAITLRPFAIQDFDELYQLTRQPEITDILPDWDMTKEQLNDFMSFVIGSYEQFNPADVRILLAVEHNNDKRLIGWCGVFPNDLLDPSVREVAYAISKDYRNQGFSTSAVEAILSFVFQKTELEQITAIVKPFNGASRRVVEKAGFQHLKRVRLSDEVEYDYFQLEKWIWKGVGEMDSLIVRKATLEDAESLAGLMRITFDNERAKWLSVDATPDNNLCPPGYDSVEMHTFAIRHSDYFSILFEGQIIGGINIHYAGSRHARVDKLFIAPGFQGKGLGSWVLALVEALFPAVSIWKLETSSKQLSNHRFYEKAGYVRTYASDWEFGFEKQVGVPAESEHARFEDRDLTQASFENCAMSGADFYNMNMESGLYSNSNMKSSRFTDCNLSGSKWMNLNLTQALLADLRLSDSEIGFVSLDGAYIHDTNLGQGKQPIRFERCDWSGSDLQDCNLSNVSLQQCNLAGMKINNIPVEELLRVYEQSLKEK